MNKQKAGWPVNQPALMMLVYTPLLLYQLQCFLVVFRSNFYKI